MFTEPATPHCLQTRRLQTTDDGWSCRRRSLTFRLRCRANQWSKAKLPLGLTISSPGSRERFHSHTLTCTAARNLIAVTEGDVMSDQSSELVEISRLNGDFRRNYGKLLGAYLYLRSISAARGRSLFWAGILFALSVGVAWLRLHGFPWLSGG